MINSGQGHGVSSDYIIEKKEGGQKEKKEDTV